jgi:indole-3-glycerol phosphate synthase
VAPGANVRHLWLAERREALAGLSTLRLPEIVPSRRDFTQFVTTQKQGIALVPRLQRRNPETGGAWPALDLAAFARVCDDTDAGALAVRTAALFGGTMDDLDTVAASVTAPVLHDDLCIAREQLFAARLRGADAVLLPADALDAARLRELDAVATSLHMAVVVDVGTADELAAALVLATACIGLRGSGADGYADVDAVAALARGVPRRRTTLLLAEVRRLDELSRLAELIDAAVVGDALLDAADPAAAITAFLAEPA